MRTFHQKPALRAALQAARQGRKVIGFVPTMGYLHAGHASLLARARRECDVVVASIFVNPTQFAPNEDLTRYPRSPEADARLCADQGVDLLWMPDVPAMYPEGFATQVRVAGLTETLCGASRPHHFGGVATVVTKLLALVAPDRAYFGRKDAQQLAVIERLVQDLDLPVQVVGVQTYREPDGLAMSSRNVYLSEEERVRARLLSTALRASRRAWRAGERDAAALREVLLAAFAGAEGVRVDYAEVVDPATMQPLPRAPSERALAALAVFVGATRLIDNSRLDEEEPALDRA